MLRSISLFTGSVRILLVPAIISALAAFFLAGPEQTLDLYAALAQDLVPIGDWRGVLEDEFGVRALSAACLGACSLIIFCMVLWAVGREFLRSAVFPKVESNTLIACVLGIVSFLPLLGLGIGLLRSGQHSANPRFAAGFASVLADLKLPEPLASNLVETLARVPLFLKGAGFASILAALIGVACCATIEARSTRSAVSPKRAFALWPWVVFAFMAISTVAGPIWLWDWTGPFFLAGVFFSCLIGGIAHISRLSQSSRLPIISAIVGWALLLSWLGLSDNHRAFNAPVRDATAVPPPDAADQFGRWLESRTDWKAFEDKKRPYPVYVVAAQGGGMYAAYHTAAVLASLQELCPAFTSHLFAISSVSGGSVGAATFRSVLKPDNQKSSRCGAPQTTPLSDATAGILRRDFLSPLLAYLFFPDVLQRFLPVALSSFDRTRALERTLASNALAVHPNAGIESYLAHWDPKGTGPALVFNSTEVMSGRRRLISPFTYTASEVGFLPVWGNPKEPAILSLPTAAFISARFPWLTPSAWYEEPTIDRSEKPLRIGLVDGGYFESSGASTAHDLIRVMDRELARRKLHGQVELYLLVLTSPELAHPRGPSSFTEIFDPIRTMLNTRDARAYTAIARAREELGYYGSPERVRVREFPLESLGLPLPLGWRLSGRSRIMIDLQVGDPSRCQTSNKNDLAHFRADCSAKQIYDELNRGLD